MTGAHSAPAHSGWDLATLVVEPVPGGGLRLSDGRGLAHAGAACVRLFPFTEDDGPIALIGERGQELALVHSLSEIPVAAAAVIRAHLVRREFITTIQRVISSTSSRLPTEWSLLTDRGATTIRIRDEDAFRLLPRGELLITDDSGARYFIPSVDRLDSASRAIVRRFA